MLLLRRERDRNPVCLKAQFCTPKKRTAPKNRKHSHDSISPIIPPKTKSLNILHLNTIFLTPCPQTSSPTEPPLPSRRLRPDGLSQTALKFKPSKIVLHLPKLNATTSPNAFPFAPPIHLVNRDTFPPPLPTPSSPKAKIPTPKSGDRLRDWKSARIWPSKPRCERANGRKKVT